MTIKRVQPKNGKQYCGYGECQGHKVAAVWRCWHHYLPHPFACDSHKSSLQVKLDDGYMSEGDRQSWGRL